MSERVTAENLQIINPLAVIALRPDTVLTTPDLFARRYAHARFGVANMGSLLAHMLDGSEELLPDGAQTHYLGTQQAIQQHAAKRQPWPVAEITSGEKEVLEHHGVTAVQFPEFAYRLTTSASRYNQGTRAARIGNVAGIFMYNLAYAKQSSAPKIYEIDKESRTILKELWGANVGREAHDLRRQHKVKMRIPPIVGKQPAPRGQIHPQRALRIKSAEQPGVPTWRRVQ